MPAPFVNLFRKHRADDDCVEVRNLSSDHLDGELDQASADMVAAHLEWCPPCRAFFRTLMATVGLLGSSKKQEVPDSFRARLSERLRIEAD